MKLTSEQLALLYLQIEPKIADQFIEHYRALEAELDNWKDISGQAHDACIEAEAERDIARGQALREAAELTTTLDPRHDDIHGFILALLSKSDAEALAEQDQSTREKYRADLIAEGWIGPVQAEQVAIYSRNRASNESATSDPASGRSETITKGEWQGSIFEFELFSSLLKEFQEIAKGERQPK
jgi:hypothetical protein